MKKAFTEMDKAVQQNAANAEESASSSEEMSSQAEQMKNLVAELVALIGSNRKNNNIVADIEVKLPSKLTSSSLIVPGTKNLELQEAKEVTLKQPIPPDNSEFKDF